MDIIVYMSNYHDHDHDHDNTTVDRDNLDIGESGEGVWVREGKILVDVSEYMARVAELERREAEVEVAENKIRVIEKRVPDYFAGSYNQYFVNGEGNREIPYHEQYITEDSVLSAIIEPLERQNTDLRIELRCRCFQVSVLQTKLGRLRQALTRDSYREVKQNLPKIIVEAQYVEDMEKYDTIAKTIYEH